MPKFRFINSRSIYFIYSVVETVLGTGDTVANPTEYNLGPHGAYILEQKKHQQTK